MRFSKRHFARSGIFHANWRECSWTPQRSATSAENRGFCGSFQMDEGQVGPVKHAIQCIVESNAQKDRDELATQPDIKCLWTMLDERYMKQGLREPSVQPGRDHQARRGHQ